MAEISENTLEEVVNFLVKVHNPSDEESAARLKGAMLKWHLDEIEHLIELCRKG